MLRPDIDRLRLTACLNGWLLVIESWNNEEQRWEEAKSWVFQEAEVLSHFLLEQLMVPS